MEIRTRYFGAFLSTLLVCRGILLSQQPGANGANGDPLPVGVWESTQPDGITVGIDLSVVSKGVPDAVYPEGTPRPHGSRLQIGVFQRKQKRITYPDEIFFETDWTGPGSEDGITVYENRKLEIKYHGQRDGHVIEVELVLDPIKDEWTGRFHRDKFDRQVTLLRLSDRADIAAPKLLLTSTDTPALFRLEMQNQSTQDLLLNLGIEVGGREQYVDALEYTLTTPDGRVLHLTPPGPGLIAARVDPMIVPLASGAKYSFLVDLDEYSAQKEKILKLDLAPGRYTLRADYTGKAVSIVNVDCGGIVGMHYWVGTVASAPIEFTVPPNH